MVQLIMNVKGFLSFLEFGYGSELEAVKSSHGDVSESKLQVTLPSAAEKLDSDTDHRARDEGTFYVFMMLCPRRRA